MIISLIRFLLIGPMIQPLALLGTGGAVGFWLGMTDVGSTGRILAATALAIAALAAIIWRYRDHARQRWQAALNTYAEREIARSNVRQMAKLVRRAG